MNNGNESGINFKKISLIALIIYILLVTGFYFLAGEQLLYRNSRGSLASSHTFLPFCREPAVSYLTPAPNSSSVKANASVFCTTR